MTKSNDGPGLAELVILLALLMSMMALAIDTVLPALPFMGADLGVTDPTDNQLIISILFAGLGVGQLVWGPLSDSIGRKPAVYWGISFFVAGCMLSLFATSFEMMLAGRALQGFGAAATRIITVAIVRDSLSGRAMARIMSFIMAVFILVPILSPIAGQGILYIGDWRLIFVSFLVLAAISTAWFALRQHETLPEFRRRPFTPKGIGGGVWQAATNRVTLGYTIATGFVFAPFLAYISSSQQVFQDQYGTGDAFVLYFAAGAITVGLSSILNGRIVMRFGMHKLLHTAQVGQVLASLALLGWMAVTGAQPGLILFMAYLMVTFFGVGMLFSNMNAVAMEPQGANAGAASAFIGFFSTMVGLPIGMAIGQLMSEGVAPLAAGFALCSGASFLISRWADRSQDARDLITTARA